MVCASDAGIVYAHDSAACYYIFQNDYIEAERRLFMLYNSNEDDIISIAFQIIKCINEVIKNEDQPTRGMLEMIKGLRNKGCDIIKTEKGTYMLAKKNDKKS